MKLSTDHSFHIGYQHLRNGEPCQDFAISGRSRQGAYAIVSDGCSTGGHTDVGARLVALAARQQIVGSMWSSPTLYNLQNTLGLDPKDMLATCCIAQVDDQGRGSISIAGDGVYAYRTSTDRIVAVKVEWAQNMPCYPVYAADNYAGFIAAQGGDLDAPVLTWEQWEGKIGEPMAAVCGDTVTLGSAVTCPFMENFNSLALDGGGYVAVFTDGVQQVEGEAWYNVVQDLLNFKTTAGSFVRRRLKRFITGSAGHGPQDDIACAVIRIESEEVVDGV